MERILLGGTDTERVATRAAEILREGGVVLYPTDTLYGLGADALSNTAVGKVIDIKGRNERKPIHAIVSDLDMAKRYGVIPEIIETLARELPQGKITFIVRKLDRFDTGILRGPTFGFRIPDNELCLAMIRAFDGPVTTTSANRAGARPERDVDGILGQLGNDIDLVIDSGELAVSAPSTVLDLSGESPKLLREGAISAAEIAPFLSLG